MFSQENIYIYGITLSVLSDVCQDLVFLNLFLSTHRHLLHCISSANIPHSCTHTQLCNMHSSSVYTSFWCDYFTHLQTYSVACCNAGCLRTNHPKNRTYSMLKLITYSVALKQSDRLDSQKCCYCPPARMPHSSTSAPRHT